MSVPTVPAMRDPLTLLAVLVLHLGAHAQFTEPRPAWWITDGTVRAVAVDTASGTVALGGTFAYVGPNNPFGAEIDLGTGTVRTDRPRINGPVHAVVSDGAGGWYIGGSFTKVGDQVRSNLAHILADGTVGSWAPVTNGPVHDLLLDGDTVYLTGYFGQVNGNTRSRLAAVNAISGTLTAFWDGAVNAPGNSYLSLGLIGDTLYVAGSIGNVTVLGVPYTRSGLMAIALPAGNMLSWSPQASDQVNGLWVSGDTLVVSGLFTSMDGTPRNGCAAVTTAGVLLPWDPQVTAPPGGVVAVSIASDRIHLGGSFTAVQGQPAERLATVDRNTGALLPAQPAPPSGAVTCMVLSDDGTRLFVGGNFKIAAGQARWRLAVYNTVTNTLAPLDVRHQYSPSTLAVAPGGLFSGGLFTSCGGRSVNNLALLDLGTGAAQATQPALGLNAAVHSLTFHSGRWFAGGAFTAPRQRLLSFDATTLTLDAWEPTADGPVDLLLADGSDLFVAGAFTQAGGAPRNGLAVLDPASNTATAWDPAPDGPVLALTVKGQEVHAGGAFNTIGGSTRRGVAALDRSSGAALPALFDLDVSGTCHALLRIDSTLLVAGHFTAFNGTPAVHLVRAHAATGVLDTLFDAAPADTTVSALAKLGSQLFIGGPFTVVDGQSRGGVAALHPVSGVLGPFDPMLSSGPVLGLHPVDDLLLIAGGFTLAQGTPGRSLNVHRACTTTPWYTDADGDGRGDPGSLVLACDAPPGTVADGTDCDDSNNSSYPGASCDDGDPYTANDVMDNTCQCAGSTVELLVKVFLGGPYGPLPNIMADGMRNAGLVPTTEPYTALGFTHHAPGGGETIAPAVLSVTGPDAIVDWIFLELRSSTSPTTVLATRSCLLQRDGDLVDLDGSSAVHLFIPTGEYHVALRHRNHLPVMTGSAVTLQPGVPAVLRLDLPSTPTYGSDARRNIAGVMVLWAGDGNGNGQVKYAGGGNDRDLILVAIGGSVPTASVPGYLRTDITLDGTVKYTGPNNDRDPVLLAVGGAVPSAVRYAQLP